MKTAGFHSAGTSDRFTVTHFTKLVYFLEGQPSHTKRVIKHSFGEYIITGLLTLSDPPGIQRPDLVSIPTMSATADS